MASSLKETEEQLFNECHKLAEKLTEIQQPSSSQMTPKNAEDIRRYNLKVLDHEEKILKQREPLKVLNNRLVVATNFDKDLDKLMQDSNEIFSTLQESVAENELKLEEKSTVMREQRQIAQGIQKELKKMAEKEVVPTEEQFTEQYMKQLKLGHEIFGKERKEIEQKMANFLNAHFPALENSFSKDSAEYFPLHHIIQKLIKSSIETPENPYLEITEEFWPPHIELLLRYNICCRHKDNSSMVKLLYTGV